MDKVQDLTLRNSFPVSEHHPARHSDLLDAITKVDALSLEQVEVEIDVPLFILVEELNVPSVFRDFEETRY